jgi:hypothetical protein
MKTKDVLIF